MNRLIIPFLSLLLVSLASARPDEAARLDEVTSTPAPDKTHMIGQGTTEDRTRLAAHLFKDYNKNINPDGVTVGFGVALIDFSIDGKTSTVDATLWLRHIWNDTRLAWKPEEYGNLSVLRFPSSQVWKPDITLYSSATEKVSNCWDSQVLMYSTGEVVWVPPCQVTSYCPGMNLHKHPYGEQTCSFKFGSWTYDGNTVGIKLFNDKAELDLSDLNNSSGFKIVSNHAEKVDKKYPCCEEPYPYIQYNFTVKRIPERELYDLH